MKLLKENYNWYNKNKYGKGDKNKLIYNNGYNEVKLCSKHHNELHYGTIPRRKEILNKLVDEKYKNELHKLVNNPEDEQSIVKYIYNQYNVEYNDIKTNPNCF